MELELTRNGKIIQPGNHLGQGIYCLALILMQHGIHLGKMGFLFFFFVHGQLLVSRCCRESG